MRTSWYIAQYKKISIKNKLYRVLFSAVFMVGLMLPTSTLCAQELNKATVSTDPMPPLGHYNDFEEMHWKEEILAVIAKAKEMKAQGKKELPY